jgi:hypothetical protein
VGDIGGASNTFNRKFDGGIYSIPLSIKQKGQSLSNNGKNLMIIHVYSLNYNNDTMKKDTK